MNFLSTGQKVNQTHCKEFLINWLKRIRRKRPQQFHAWTWLLHHNNKPANSSIREFLADKKVTVVPYLYYSPHFAQRDNFFVFKN